MPKIRKDDLWWPTLLQHIPAMNFLSEEMVSVAELSDGEKADSIRDFYMALIDPGAADCIVKQKPLLYDYEPGNRFKLKGSWSEFEPLVLRWEGGANHHVQIPAHRFLCAYDLVPRPVSGTASVVVWDDMAKPLRGIVRAEMVSVYSFPTQPPMRIQFRRDYLLEYANRTNRSIIVLWYECNSGPNQDENGQPYTEADFHEFDLPGRTIRLSEDPNDPDNVEAELWGVFLVYSPIPVNCSIFDDTPPLVWPGVDGQVTKRSANSLGMQRVYVKDSVLGKYEEDPQTFTVYPEHGAVSYGNQWAVGNCRRVGRDLIAVEIKKLYEGTRAHVIQHWHSHAVTPPPNPFHREPNVGTRAKRIVFALFDLGDALCRLCEVTNAATQSAIDFVGLDREKLQRTLWHDNDAVRPITRHIPRDIGKDTFLVRCQSLEKLVVEGFDKGQQHLRRLLTDWDPDKKSIEESRSLKLLERLLQLVLIANETGLSLSRQFQIIEQRYNEKLAPLNKGEHLQSPIAFLFALYDIRLQAAHRGGNHADLLAALDITDAHVADGWGRQLDKVYDRVAQSLESATNVLRKQADSASNLS